MQDVYTDIDMDEIIEQRIQYIFKKIGLILPDDTRDYVQKIKLHANINFDEDPVRMIDSKIRTTLFSLNDETVNNDQEIHQLKSELDYLKDDNQILQNQIKQQSHNAEIVNKEYVSKIDELNATIVELRSTPPSDDEVVKTIHERAVTIKKELNEHQGLRIIEDIVDYVLHGTADDLSNSVILAFDHLLYIDTSGETGDTPPEEPNLDITEPDGVYDTYEVINGVRHARGVKVMSEKRSTTILDSFQEAQ